MDHNQFPTSASGGPGSPLNPPSGNSLDADSLLELSLQNLSGRSFEDDVEDNINSKLDLDEEGGEDLLLNRSNKIHNTIANNICGGPNSDETGIVEDFQQVSLSQCFDSDSTAKDFEKAANGTGETIVDNKSIFNDKENQLALSITNSTNGSSFAPGVQLSAIGTAAKDKSNLSLRLNNVIEVDASVGRSGGGDDNNGSHLESPSCVSVAASSTVSEDVFLFVQPVGSSTVPSTNDDHLTNVQNCSSNDNSSTIPTADRPRVAFANSDVDLVKSDTSNSQFVSKITGKAMTAILNEQEEQATREFLEKVNGARVSKGISPLSWNAGVKFLMARKFNVRRALDLYEQHISVRLQETLISFDPESEPLKTELESGKFTVLPARDLGDAAIAVFTAKLHQPSTIPHEHTLKGVVYQLDAALEDPKTQRSGLVFIYDMSESKYSNFDYDLSIKILSLLKGGYPARLKKVLIVTAPLWFRAPFRILRLFVCLVDTAINNKKFQKLYKLGAHIPNCALPRSLGGQLVVDHLAWLNHCHQILSTTDLWGIYSDESLQLHIIEDMATNSRENLETDGEVPVSSMSNGHQNSQSQKLRRNGTSTSSQSTPSPQSNSSGSSGFSDDDSLPFEERTGLTLLEFVEHLKQKGRRGLQDEYNEIVSKVPDGSFNVSRQRGNLSKNRYSDVLCFDHTRVVLSSEAEGECDYINANFVDGYKQKNAFISTQGPLPRTFGDFWKMIWEQTCVVLVMTTRAVERGRTKCGQYWPPDKGSSVTHEGFKLENTDVESHPDYAVTRLKLTNTRIGEFRTITHIQFLSWPDYGVPSSATAMLQVLQTMRQEQMNGTAALGVKWTGNPLGPPVVVHCSAGIGRTGTLCTMDICTRRLQDQGTIDVMGTVERIRSQRAHSIQVPEQYLFCHAAMIEYARSQDMLTEAQIDGLPDLLAEGDSDSE